MNITVFGANGRVGKMVVANVLARGHDVTAFVHNKSTLLDNPRLTIVKGDIYKPDDVHKAIKGSDAVISCLGSWGTPKQDILATGMKHIIVSMKAEKISRIISLTGSDARAPGDDTGTIHQASHALMGLVAGKILRDGERHITLLDASDLDWTVVRSPAMIGGKNDRYRLVSDRPFPWAIVRRAAVVKAMVDLACGVEHPSEAPYIA